MDKRLLTILRCPISQKGLSLLKKDRLARVNALIGEGDVVNHAGVAVTEALSEALVTDDGARLYPIDDGIPVLLEEESISMEQLA
jgi:uncharacterized protein YbaR (Trm112 family)